jgi:hypothetical protein
MTASENKTSSCEQRICFRSMMALHLVFSWDGARMASYGIPYVGLTLVVLDLVIVAKYVFFISIDVSFQITMNFGSK